MHLPAFVPRVFPILAAAMIAAPATLAAQAAAPADPPASGALYDELARADSTLFDAAFVSCDAARVNAMFTADAEFYHDVTGAQVGDEVRAAFLRLTRNCPARQGVRRVVVPGSLRVYPMNNYGAVQMGVHRFVQANGEPAGIASFVHLWKRVDGRWLLARVISYDHRVDAPQQAGGGGR